MWNTTLLIRTRALLSTSYFLVSSAISFRMANPFGVGVLPQCNIEIGTDVGNDGDRTSNQFRLRPPPLSNVICCWLKYPLLDFPLTFLVKPQFSRKYYDLETQDLLKSPVGHWGRSVNQLCLPHIVTFTPSIRVICFPKRMALPLLHDSI